ncbi:MAG: hypothetical protein ACFFBX_07810 [Promethearchaeota archaeon]
MKKVFAYVCLINGIYDIILGLVFLIIPRFLLNFLGAPENIFTATSFQVIGVLLLSLGIGLVAAFRNLDGLLIIPFIKIIAHLAGGIMIYHAITSALSVMIIVFGVIDIIFALLYILFFLLIKDYNFRAVFKTSRT